MLLCGPVYAVEYQVAFSPHGGAKGLIVSEIDAARESIHVAAYGFTSKPIIGALCAASVRGVDVRVVVDKGQRGVNGCGLNIRWDRHYAIMHNKFMIFDGKVLEAGSFNFTGAAEKRNAENVLIVKDVGLASVYEVQWKRLWDESE